LVNFKQPIQQNTTHVLGDISLPVEIVVRVLQSRESGEDMDFNIATVGLFLDKFGERLLFLGRSGQVGTGVFVDHGYKFFLGKDMLFAKFHSNF